VYFELARNVAKCLSSDTCKPTCLSHTFDTTVSSSQLSDLRIQSFIKGRTHRDIEERYRRAIEVGSRVATGLVSTALMELEEFVLEARKLTLTLAVDVVNSDTSVIDQMFKSATEFVQLVRQTVDDFDEQVFQKTNYHDGLGNYVAHFDKAASDFCKNMEATSVRLIYEDDNQEAVNVTATHRLLNMTLPSMHDSLHEVLNVYNYYPGVAEYSPNRCTERWANVLPYASNEILDVQRINETVEQYRRDINQTVRNVQRMKNDLNEYKHVLDDIHMWMATATAVNQSLPFVPISRAGLVESLEETISKATEHIKGYSRDTTSLVCTCIHTFIH